MKNYGTLFRYSALAIITLASINLAACGESSANPVTEGSGGDPAVSTAGTGGLDLGPDPGTGGQSMAGGSGANIGSSGIETGDGGASGGVTGGVGGLEPEPFDSGTADGSEVIPTSGAGGGEDIPPTGLTIITGTEPIAAGCQGLQFPQVSDYEALPPNGPFATTKEDLVGPAAGYTLFRPTNLDEAGVSLHPIATWGNGITTTPEAYVPLLSTFASHGFVVIASNNSTVNSGLMTAGLDWLIQQNNTPGQFQGKLATQCALSIGYSLGGQAAVGAGAHPAVVATISFHGLTGAAAALHGPLLILTSTDDGFVTKAANAVPTYAASLTQPTIMATFFSPDPPSMVGHIRPVNTAGDERAPALAWARLWIYGDSGAKKYFFGPDCILALPPWTDLQRKNYNW